MSAPGEGEPGDDVGGARQGLRIDKWLFHARFFKTRSLAARLVAEGKMRVDGTRISKPSRIVAPGDTLTFPQGHAIRVIRILALGTRRGPAPEARALYEDLSPPEERPFHDPAAPRADIRPGRKDRRTALLLRGKPLE